MRPLLKYTISLFLCLGVLNGLAQDSLKVDSIEVDSIQIKPSRTDTLVVGAVAADSIRAKRNAIDIYADYGKGIETLIGRQIKWEFGISLLLYEHYNLVVEYGFGSLNPKNVINNGSYNAEGNYYRFGGEYIIKVVPKRTLSFGAMYGITNFNDNVSLTIDSDLWTPLNQSYERIGLKASWLELILHTQGPISKADGGFLSHFYWGARFRLRILVSDISQPNFDIYAIPGYGKTYSSVVPAANLFIKYRIGF